MRPSLGSLAALVLGCASTGPHVQTDRWIADSGASIEGTWEASTSMSEKEAGICQVAVDAFHMLMVCSPGSRRMRFVYSVVSRTADATLIDATPEDESALPNRLSVSPVRSADGRRALRITDVEHPEAAPLGAYGQPDIWFYVPSVPSSR